MIHCSYANPHHPVIIMGCGYPVTVAHRGLVAVAGLVSLKRDGIKDGGPMTRPSLTASLRCECTVERAGVDPGYNYCRDHRATFITEDQPQGDKYCPLHQKKKERRSHTGSMNLTKVAFLQVNQSQGGAH